MPKLNFPLPAVRGLSENTGPKVSVLRLNTPSSGSKVYVNPAEDDPSGNVDSCEAMPRFSWRSVSWALGCDTKWAAWLNGSGASWRMTGLLGEKNRSNRLASPSDAPWARDGVGAASTAARNAAATNRRCIDPPLFRNGSVNEDCGRRGRSGRAHGGACGRRW